MFGCSQYYMAIIRTSTNMQDILIQVFVGPYLEGDNQATNTQIAHYQNAASAVSR